MAVLFINIKTAFDSVDREILIKCIRKKRLREGLVVRCKEMLKETMSKVRVGEKRGKDFGQVKG